MNVYNPENQCCKINSGVRNSNLELYRILCMLMIVAHHFVVNSGLTSPDGSLIQYPTAVNSLYLWSIGMWGKTGINCFLMITGYFMCKSSIRLRKFIKLISQIYFYNIVIFLIFLFAGYEQVTLLRLVYLIMPVWNFESNFVSCFIVFWLTIPFWNILIHNMSKKQHEWLLLLLLSAYTVLGSIPKFHVSFNYITWFGIIYLIASYIRLYPIKVFSNTRLWALLTLLSISIAALSMYVMVLYLGGGYGQYFVADSNKIFAVTTAVVSFLWFKNIHIPYSKTINLIGGSTFAVLLIHANSSAMRTWLWQDTVDCVGNYQQPLLELTAYSLFVVIAIFASCILIDRVRILLIEKPLFQWYDKRYLK